MAVQIFKEEEHQRLFDKQGFIVLPFLTEAEVRLLDSFFDEVHPQLDKKGFFSGSYSSDYSYKKKASDAIVDVFTPHYERLFVNYTPFGAAFLCKAPGQNSALAAHQDWTIVDEEKALALNCWVPLCDITPENGPIMILPGSQFSNSKTLRAPTLPFFFSGNEDVIHSQLEPMLVKAGTAVILNQSVVHYSPDNTTDKIRKAITAGVKSSGAQMVFHYKLPQKDELEVFEEDDDFLIRFDDFFEDIGQRPKNGVSKGFIPFTFSCYGRDELIHVIADMKAKAGYTVNPFPMSTGNESKAKKSVLKKITHLLGLNYAKYSKKY